MERNRIVVIGAAILDVLAVPTGPEVFESGSYPAQDIRMSPGGDALNEAVVLAELGADVVLETVIGDDMAGELVLNYCRAHGVAVDGKPRGGLATGINIVLVEKDGERSFVTNARGSLRSLKLSDIRVPFPQDVGILCFASIFVFPEIGPQELTELFRAAKAQGMLVCADMTKRKNGETLSDIAGALAYVDYLFANEEEAGLVTGESKAQWSAKALWEAGAKHVVIKCGDRGCYIKNGTLERMVPAEKGVRCIDTTGAGDSFAAGFIFALSKGRSFAECAEYANWCGGRAVEEIGATAWIRPDNN